MVGGGGHRTGNDEHTEQKYHEARRFAWERFGMSPDWQWSAQDFMPVDGLPYIGPITDGRPHTSWRPVTPNGG